MATRRALIVEPRRRFARVRVSTDRVIRTVVGLRPFRPSGFVVRADKLDAHTIIHNYGHGGGGMTMSWGTAHLALEHALETGERTCAVIGCGGVGLATARLLQRHGFAVTIYARDLPPDTTSNISGAQWAPAESYDPAHRTPAFAAQFERAARLSHREYQNLPGDTYGIRWIENYVVSDTPPAGPQGATQNIADLYPDTHDLRPGDHPFPGRYVRRFTTMLIEPPIYLTALMRDFLLAGGKLIVRELADLRAVAMLPEPVVINCTGLGARQLFGDDELMPIKGQLSVLLPQPEIDYITLSDDLYMFPRRDGILLGGTHERGVWTLEPNLEAQARVVAGHQRFFERMR
ncbi:MAG TPA: FAD-dependent oxidoreductase [Vicinamibacterales bacterium]|nr:FAD-dependent oxidoreductase [Vicinamibacterales bacterium]